MKRLLTSASAVVSRFPGFFLAAALLLPAPVRGGVNAWTRLGLDGKGIGSVVIDPLDGRQVYAAAGYDGDLRGLWKSSDGGRSWGDASSGLPGAIVFSLAADEKRPGTCYAVNGDDLRFSNGKPLFPFGIYKSEDAAATWAPLGEKGVSVVVPRGGSGRIYAGGSGAVLSSDDAGKTWRRSAIPPLQPQIFAELSIVTLALAQSDPSRIYAGVDADMDYPDTVAIYRSDDAGATWKFRVDGLPPLSAFSFAVDPVDSGRVLVATSKGVFWSANGGDSWTESLSAHVRTLAADPTDPAVVYAGTLSGVYLSRDQGLTWIPMNPGLSDTRVLSLAIDGTGRHLYAGTRSGLFGFEVAIGPVDVAAAPGGGTTYVAVTSGTKRIVLGTVDASGKRREQAYGPYEGWAPQALASSADGLTRVLWTNLDGRSVVWLVGPDGVLGSFVLEADGGRTASDITGGPDGQSRVLLTGPSGASLRAIDARGNSIGLVELGFYPGWSATAISDGADGLTRLLWTNTDGRTGISRVSLTGIVATDRYAAVAGWTSVDAAAGGDGRTRILRTDNNGRITLWIIDGSGTILASGPIYDPPSGLTPRRLSAGPDGTSRVLLTDSGSAAAVWILSPEGVLQASFGLD